MKFRLSALLCLFMLSYGASVFAQEQQARDVQDNPVRGLRAERAEFDLPVDSRRPDDFLNSGLYFKGFNYLPSLTVGGRYNDNIFAESDNEDSDFIVSVEPALTVRKFFGPHILVLGARANIEQFTEFSNENKEEFALNARAVLEGNSKWQFPVSAGYSRNFRERSAQDDSFTTTEPTAIDRFELNAGVNRRFNRLSLLLMGSYTDVSFEDGTAGDGSGNPVVFSDNDRSTVRLDFSPRYELVRGDSPDDIEHVVFANIGVGRQSFDRGNFTGSAFDGVSGDRDEISAGIGFETSYKGILFANLSAGILRQDFDEASLDSISEFDFDAAIEYNLTPKLTLGFTAGREIEQDNDFVSGIVRTEFDFNADYELLHDVYLESNIGYSTFDFEDSTREDEDLEFGLGINYLGSRYFEGDLSFRYLDRTSNLPDEELDRFIVRLGLTTRL